APALGALLTHVRAAAPAHGGEGLSVVQRTARALHVTFRSLGFHGSTAILTTDAALIAQGRRNRLDRVKPVGRRLRTARARDGGGSAGGAVGRGASRTHARRAQARRPWRHALCARGYPGRLYACGAAGARCGGSVGALGPQPWRQSRRGHTHVRDGRGGARG